MSLHTRTKDHFRNMHATSAVALITAIVTHVVCSNGSAPSHLAWARSHYGPLSNDDSEDYLLVQNARKFCDGGNILEADCENPLEIALETCTGDGNCTFLCHTAKKRYPPISSAAYAVAPSSDTTIPKSSASWLCGGSGWMQLYPKNGWVTAIKGSVLRNLCKPFTVWLNQAAECQKADTLDIARGITPSDATRLCASMAGCSFFTMSLESHESEMAFGTLTHFCRGVPTKRSARDGHFLVTSPPIEEDMHHIVPVERVTPSRIAYYFGGPLTNDAYYDDKTPGSLVPATRL